MDISEIKNIVNNNLINDNSKKSLIIKELAKSEDVIPLIMLILEEERRKEKSLILDLNILLSKAQVGLEEPKFNKDGFMQKEITEFYKEGRIGHCFKNI